MTEEEVFKKLIDKAVNNGWQIFGAGPNDPYLHREIITPFGRPALRIERMGTWRSFSMEEVIFDPEFLKAFFGYKPYFMGKLKDQHHGGDKINFFIGGPYWEYQLIRIALAKDRIRYLEKFLEPSLEIILEKLKKLSKPIYN